MSSLLVRLVLTVGAMASMPVRMALASDVPENPTFISDVAPILARRCTGCHSEHGSMPRLSLTSYEAASKASGAIGEQISTRKMPPWYADPKESVAFRNDPRLSAMEETTLLRWLANGAPRGRGSEPDWPASPTAWAHPMGRQPDVIVGLPRVKLPANGEMPYVRLLIKVTVPQDEWIAGLQALPGNPSVVHHMGITEVTLAEGVTPQNMAQLDAVARQLGMPDGALTNPHPSIADPDNPAVYDMLSVYTPGTTYESFGEHAGKLLRAGPQQYINFNIHYTTSGRPETDQSRLGLWFAAKTPEQQLYRAPMPGRTILANGRELLRDDPGTKAEGTDLAIPPIAAGEQHYELIGMTAVLTPMTIHALQPHAHLRAKSFRYRLVLPDGGERTLLSVPAYDFHWQLRYELTEPLRVPAGSKLVVTGEYDNSTNNAHLVAAAAEDPSRRCGPDKIVHFRDQNQTWDEMFSPLVEYALARPASATPGPLRQAVKTRVRLAAATGCLARAANGTWNVTNIGSFQSVVSQSTSRTEVAALGRQPAGTLSVRLIGVEAFSPAPYIGRRVVAQGALITGDHSSLLNVTSLQPAGEPCAP